MKKIKRNEHNKYTLIRPSRMSLLDFCLVHVASSSFSFTDHVRGDAQNLLPRQRDSTRPIAARPQALQPATLHSQSHPCCRFSSLMLRKQRRHVERDALQPRQIVLEEPLPLIEGVEVAQEVVERRKRGMGEGTRRVVLLSGGSLLLRSLLFLFLFLH